MLLTITPNPSIDRTLAVPQLNINGVHRATAVHLAAGGKGLNVARADPVGLCIKVTRAELATAWGRELDRVAQIVEPEQRLITRGAVLVVVTLGREGALAITAEGSWQVKTPAVEVISAVGSGDALLA